MVFWNGAHFFECLIQGKEIAFSQVISNQFSLKKVHGICDYEDFSLAYSLFKSCVQYLQTFEANLHFQHFRNENYICFKCLQILHAEHEYPVCS